MAAKKSAVRRSTSDSKKRFAAWVRDMKRAGWSVEEDKFFDRGYYVIMPHEADGVFESVEVAWRALRHSLPKRCRG